MRVATPIFMLLNYFLLYTLLTKKLGAGTKILLWFAMIGSIVTVLVWHEAMQEEARGSAAEFEDGSAENMGSGRVGTWLGRIEMLSRSSVPTLLFGRGPGSDRFVSEIWWWEKKDSHHDLLTTVIESGFIGLMAVFLFLFLLFRRLGREGVPLVWFLLSGSLVSNALFQRPIIATIFWIAVALAVLRVDAILRSRWRRNQLRRRNLQQRAGAASSRQRHRAAAMGPNTP